MHWDCFLLYLWGANHKTENYCSSYPGHPACNPIFFSLNYNGILYLYPSIHRSVPICQNQSSSRLVKQRYGPFLFLAYFTSVCQGKSTKAHKKCSPMGEALWRTIFHVLGMVFRQFRVFCIVCFDLVFKGLFPAFSIRQNTFPSQKSGKSDGNVFVQIVILPKAIGTWFQPRLLFHNKKNPFIGQSISALFSTCGTPKNTNS